MIDISPLDREDRFFSYEIDETPPRHAETIAKTALFGLTIIALGLVAIAPSKKRRPPPLFSIGQVDIPPPEQPKLPAPCCNAIERPIVEEVFQIIAEQDVSLALSAPHLLKLKKKIFHIHPFSFLLAAPKQHVTEIFAPKTGFKAHLLALLYKQKINGVIDGIREGMERESRGKNLHHYIESFASVMGKESQQIHIFIQSWEKTRDSDDRNAILKMLIHYLFDIKQS